MKRNKSQFLSILFHHHYHHPSQQNMHKTQLINEIKTMQYLKKREKVPPMVPMRALLVVAICAINLRSVLSSSNPGHPSSYSSPSHPLLSTTSHIPGSNPFSDEILRNQRLSSFDTDGNPLLIRGRARISTDPIDVDYSDIHQDRLENAYHSKVMNMDTLNHSPYGSAYGRDNHVFASIPIEELQLTIPSNSHTISESQHHSQSNPHLKQKYLKTGTTIVGLQTKDTIILAADTRATNGPVVADTRCEKVHQLCANVWCCGAGTSADLDALTRKVRYTFLLRGKVMDTIGNDGFLYGQNSDHCEDGNDVDIDDGGVFRSEEEEDINQTLGKVSISSICQMIREDLTKGGGNIGANLVLGGVDPYTQHPILTAIHPHGSMDVVPYTALGSGGLAAMGVLEAGFRVDMNLEDGIELVKSAVLAGIKNDLGSGSQVSQ